MGIAGLNRFYFACFIGNFQNILLPADLADFGLQSCAVICLGLRGFSPLVILGILKTAEGADANMVHLTSALPVAVAMGAIGRDTAFYRVVAYFLITVL